MPGGRDGLGRWPPGYSLVEILIVLLVLSLFSAAVLPPIFRSTARLRVRLAGRELVGILRLTRLYAIRHGANVAVKFREAADGTVSFSLYRDVDGDGVRNSDIDSGIDLPMTPSRSRASTLAPDPIP